MALPQIDPGEGLSRGVWGVKGDQNLPIVQTHFSERELTFRFAIMSSPVRLSASYNVHAPYSSD